MYNVQNDISLQSMELRTQNNSIHIDILLPPDDPYHVHVQVLEHLLVHHVP